MYIHLPSPTVVQTCMNMNINSHTWSCTPITMATDNMISSGPMERGSCITNGCCGCDLKQNTCTVGLPQASGKFPSGLVLHYGFSPL